MVMVDNEAGDDRKDFNGGPKSPWKKTPPEALDSKPGGDASAMMGADSWPALGDAQRLKTSDIALKMVAPAASSVVVSPPAPATAAQVWQPLF